MSKYLVLSLLAASAWASPTELFSRGDSDCKAWPGTASWPAEWKWKALNTTVGGRLSSTVPLAAVCHETFNGQATYDAEKCAEVSAQWLGQDMHFADPTSIMYNSWTNDTCLPTADPTEPCTLGAYPNYVVTAQSWKDVKFAVDFARTNNVRLVIKNTGHDFMGKSIGAGSLSIWTHKLKDFEVIENYSANGTPYNGPAAKIGAAWQVGDLYAELEKHGMVAMGGECAGVGVAGGYIQGGGHGPLSTVLGLATDHVLSFEVVTADGRLVTASASENPDLFWALRGGGAGAWGVIISMTVKTFPTMPVSGASLIFQVVESNWTQFWSAIETLHARTPYYVDNGLFVYMDMLPGYIQVKPFFGVNKTKDEIDTILSPLLTELTATGIPFAYESSEHETFFKGWTAMFETEQSGVGVFMSSRLIQREHFENNGAITKVFEGITNKGAFWSNHIFAPGKNGVLEETSVNPVWKNAIMFPMWFYPVEGFGDEEWNTLIESVAVDDANFKAITPGSGTYINEANIYDPNWKEELFGVNYPRLLSIKEKWDPSHVFWVQTAVGSDALKPVNGRLCRA